MKNITPHLWFDTEAKAAAEFYTTVFENCKITNMITMKGTPSGDCDLVSFEIDGQQFMAISAGPYFKTNPSVSFFLNFDPSRYPDAEDRLAKTYEKIMDGGKALMELNEYPFSKKYAWVEDKFGISWQLMLTNPNGEPKPFVVSSMMFVGDNAGKAGEAMDFYTSVFKDGKRGVSAPYPAEAGEKPGSLMYADFYIFNTWIAAMDSGADHKFQFNEAISFLIPSDTQEDIDYYFEKLSAVPESEQCGWLKDKFGFSWQVWPNRMGEMMATGTQEQIDRVTKAFMPMKRFDIAKLEEAFEGR